jgi:hypothetical protein
MVWVSGEVSSERILVLLYCQLSRDLRHVDTHQPADLQVPLQSSSLSSSPSSSPCYSSLLLKPCRQLISGYDTLARRSSSYPKPLNLFALPSWQGATGSREYVDLHDLSNIDNLRPNNYDVLVTGINEKTLRTEISKVFGIDYLAKATGDDVKREVDVINGYLYGDGRCVMVPRVVSNDMA